MITVPVDQGDPTHWCQRHPEVVTTWDITRLNPSLYTAALSVPCLKCWNEGRTDHVFETTWVTSGPRQTGKTEQAWPHYFSTYCMHDLHDDCRLTCKHCSKACRCACHDAQQSE